MLHLIAASLLWAFSFGLIKTRLTGVDPTAVAFWRLALSALVFAPWLVRRQPARARLAALGALQFGLMYVLYLTSYRQLPAHGVAVATIFTPLYVIALEDGLARRFERRHLAAALLAVAGAAVVQVEGRPLGSVPGFLLVQAANLCFAAGQVLYRRLAASFARGEPQGDGGAASTLSPSSSRARGCDPAVSPPRAGLTADAGSLAWMYVGAAFFAGVVAAVGGGGSRWAVPEGEWPVIVYLGLLPTALGFFLWNRGAARTSAGILAVLNNLKVPLAVAVAWLVFGETADHERAVAGLAILVAALFVAGRRH